MEVQHWKLTLLRSMALISGLLIAVIASAEVGVNIYSSAMKARFNYTQSEVELCSSLMNVGANFALPAGILYDTLGCRWSISVGLVLGVCGYGLIWLSIMFETVFSHLSGLVALFHFIAGSGLIFLFLTAVIVNVNNFSSKHRSKVSSALNGLNVGGSAILAVIYDRFFADGHVLDPGNQKFGKFVIFIAITFASLALTAMFTLRSYPAEENKQFSRLLSDSTSKDGATDYKTSQMDDRNSSDVSECDDFTTETEMGVKKEGVVSVIKTLISIFKQANIQLAFWMSFFTQAVSVSVSMNTVTFLRSLGFEDHILFVTSPMFVIVTITVFVFCAASDYIHSRCGIRYSVCIFALNITTLLCQLLMALCMQQYVWLVIGCCLTISCGQAGLSLIPSLLSNYLGLENLARSFGAFLMLFTVGYIALQRSYGAIYDYHTEISDGGLCRGPDCLLWIFMLNLILSLVSIILNFVLLLRKW